MSELNENELTPIERAKVSLSSSEYEKSLIALVCASCEITSITNTAGYDQCHGARMRLKNNRVSIEKRGKAARDDATKFSKAVIAEENRLIGIIIPEEIRLATLQEAWDREIEAEKQKKIDIENARVNGIKSRISAIVKLPQQAIGKSSEETHKMLGYAASINIDEDFMEFVEEAKHALGEALGTLKAMLAAQTDREAKELALEEGRKELARLREEQGKIIAEERKKIAEENARIDAERKVEKAKIDAERLEQEKLLNEEREKIAQAKKKLQEDQEKLNAAIVVPEVSEKKDRLDMDLFEDKVVHINSQKINVEELEKERRDFEILANWAFGTRNGLRLVMTDEANIVRAEIYEFLSKKMDELTARVREINVELDDDFK